MSTELNIFNRNFYFLLAIIIFSIILSFLFIMEKFDLLALFILFPLLLYVFQKTELAVWLIILCIFLLTYLNSVGLLPRGTKWIVEAILVLLIVKVLFLIASEKKKFIFPLGWLFITTIFFLIITSLIINKVNLITILLGLRLHFKYIILFYLLINLDFKIDFYKKTIMILFFIAIFQVPVAIIQYLTWNPSNTLGTLGRPLGFVDVARGTFGWGDTTGILALFIGSVIYCIIGYQLSNRFNFKLSFVLLLLFIPILLSQSIASFVMIPIGLVLMLLKEVKRNFSKVFSFSLLILMIIVIIFFLSGKIFDYGIVRNFNLEKVIEMQSKTDSYGRPTDTGKIAALVYTSKLIGGEFDTIIFGLGLGSTSKSYFNSFEGKLATEFSAVSGGYGMKPQIARILTEMGILGLVFYLTFFGYIYRINMKFYNTTTDKFWKSISIGFRGIIFLYLMALFYRPVLDAEPTGFSFWLMSAIVFSLVYKFRLKSLKNNVVDLRS